MEAELNLYSLCFLRGRMSHWQVDAYTALALIRLTIMSLSPLHRRPLSVCSLIAIHFSSFFHYSHLWEHTQETAVIWLFPPSTFFLILIFTSQLVTTVFIGRILSVSLYSALLFKVLIHFDSILHSSLFLIFPPRPLYSRLQHPAMQTQPVQRESELLKPPPPSPQCRSGPQRKEERQEGRRKGWKKNSEYISRGKTKRFYSGTPKLLSLFLCCAHTLARLHSILTEIISSEDQVWSLMWGLYESPISQ